MPTASALGGDWRSGKNQLFDNVEARVAGQVVNADRGYTGRRGLQASLRRLRYWRR
ncbi:hypothetical protein ACP0HM_16870 [Escherichia coli]